MQETFQAGVDTLYNQCVSCGATPADKTPTAIANAIQAIYTAPFSVKEATWVSESDMGNRNYRTTFSTGLCNKVLWATIIPFVTAHNPDQALIHTGYIGTISYNASNGQVTVQTVNCKAVTLTVRYK